MSFLLNWWTSEPAQQTPPQEPMQEDEEEQAETDSDDCGDDDELTPEERKEWDRQVAVRHYKLDFSPRTGDEIMRMPASSLKYDRSRAHVLISNHAAWPFFGLITDLDLKLLQELNRMCQQKGRLWYNETLFSEIFDSFIIAGHDNDIEAFLRLVPTRYLYTGASGTDATFMDMLYELWTDNPYVCESVNELLDDAARHWQVWYHDDTTVSLQ